MATNSTRQKETLPQSVVRRNGLREVEDPGVSHGDLNQPEGVFVRHRHRARCQKGEFNLKSSLARLRVFRANERTQAHDHVHRSPSSVCALRTKVRQFQMHTENRTHPARTDGRWRCVFFVCTCDGGLGRGRITRIRLEHHSNSVFFRVKIFLLIKTKSGGGTIPETRGSNSVFIRSTPTEIDDNSGISLTYCRPTVIRVGVCVVCYVKFPDSRCSNKGVLCVTYTLWRV